MLIQLSCEKREDEQEFSLSQPEYMNQAEQITNIIVSGLEKEEYSEINKQLSLLTQADNNKEIFVFEYPKTIDNAILVGLFTIITGFFIYFILLGIGTLILSGSATCISIAVMIISVSGIILLINYSLVKRLISKIMFKNRYNVYREILRLRNMEVIDDLATYSKQEKNIVIKDLKNAIEQKLIPQGHFSNNNIVFLVSDKAFETYSHKQGAYDHYFKTYINNRNRIKERTSEMTEILDKGNRYIDSIHNMTSIIKDKNVIKKLNDMESIISMIFHEVDINPKQAKKLGMLLNYYLPTTEKLLEAYISLDEKPIKGKSLTNMRKEIEEALDSIIHAFEGILEKIYQEYETDITSDITAMEIMLHQDELSSN